MAPQAGPEFEDRVLVLLPSARDGQRTAAVLRDAGVACSVCDDLDHLCRELGRGAGAALLTEGALAGDGARCLWRVLRDQPVWSALPLVVLAQETGPGHHSVLSEAGPSVTLVERPVRIRTLLSIVRSALRARRHQYQVRDSLAAQARQAEALRRSQTRLGLALDVAQLGTFEVDLRSDEVWVNDRGREIYGWRAGEPLTFTRVQAFFHPEDRPWVVDRVARAMAPDGEGRFELEQRIIRADGQERWIRVQGLAVREDGPGTPALRCVGTYVDISEARRIEDRLRASEARFRTLVEQVREYAIFSTDTRGRAQTWNEGVERVLGYTEAEFRGLPVEVLFTPEDRAADIPAQELDEAAQTGSGNNDRWLVRKDGRRFWAMGMTTGLRAGSGELLGFTKVIRDQTQWKLAQEELARHRDHLDVLVRERTAELEASTQRLRMAERMAALGTLSAGLGHDMGNLLLPVRMRLDALAEAPLPESFRGDLDAIRSATDYLQRLSSGLRLLALDPHRDAGKQALELGAWWRDAGAVLRNTLPRGITLQPRLPADECWVAMSRPALTQAVFNLVQNAGDAMADRANGTVTVWATPGDAGVTLGVSDDGPGMPPEVVRRCMEPFFTTKTRGISTGLGLSLVYGLIQEAGGSVEIRSTRGAGTTILLQLHSAVPGRGRDPEPKVAVVDVADARMRAFIEAELSSLSFQVRSGHAAEGEASLWVVEKAPARPRPPGLPVIVLDDDLGADAGEGMVVLGRSPRTRALREALRRFAAIGEAPEAGSGA